MAKSLNYHIIVIPAIAATAVVAMVALALMRAPVDAGVGAGVGATDGMELGAAVTGAIVTGAGVTGAGVTGAAVTGAGVIGAGVTGAGVIGAGLRLSCDKLGKGACTMDTQAIGEILCAKIRCQIDCCEVG